MSKTVKRYEEAFKLQLVKLVLFEGRSIQSVQKEYRLGVGSLNDWIKKYRPQLLSGSEEQPDIRKVLKENAELKKENEFLKKASAFFAREIK
ncbi:TPA: transposase [Listeria monocytogenes]